MPVMDYTRQKAVYPVRFQIFPADEGESAGFSLYEDDGESLGYLRDEFIRTDVSCRSLEKGFEVAGASPETLAKLENGQVCTFPLAGTRKRGVTEEEDQELEKELLADEKELAEHNMLVDLGRNDVGKISQPGTVKVDKYMEIQRYSHVMHIGSTVTGKIRKDKDVLDVVDARVHRSRRPSVR